MNPNWARWIYVSALKHFQAAADSYPIHLFIEGTHRDTVNKNQFIEFRTDGPQTTEVSHNYYHLDFEINILFSVDIGDDFQAVHRIAGWLVETMTDICVCAYGDGDASIGTLCLKQNKSNPVRVNQFGQVRTDLQIVQGTVEGSYRMTCAGS